MKDMREAGRRPHDRADAEGIEVGVADLDDLRWVVWSLLAPAALGLALAAGAWTLARIRALLAEGLL